MVFHSFEVPPKYIKLLVPHLLKIGAINATQRLVILEVLAEGEREGDGDANRAFNVLGDALQINKNFDRLGM